MGQMFGVVTWDRVLSHPLHLFYSFFFRVSPFSVTSKVSGLSNLISKLASKHQVGFKKGIISFRKVKNWIQTIVQLVKNLPCMQLTEVKSEASHIVQ